MFLLACWSRSTILLHPQWLGTFTFDDKEGYRKLQLFFIVGVSSADLPSKSQFQNSVTQDYLSWNWDRPSPDPLQLPLGQWSHIFSSLKAIDVRKQVHQKRWFFVWVNAFIIISRWCHDWDFCIHKVQSQPLLAHLIHEPRAWGS